MCHMKDTALWTIQVMDVSRDLLDCTVFENVTVFIVLYCIVFVFLFRSHKIQYMSVKTFRM